MKIKSVFAIVAMASLFASCAQEEFEFYGPQTGKVVATMENSTETRTYVTDQGYFTWVTGDQISIHANTGFILGTLNEGNGTPQGTFTYSYEGIAPNLTGYAVYPYNSSHDITENTLSFVMPSEYNLGVNTSNTNVAMLACPSDSKDQEQSFSFSHLAGAFRISFKNAPVGASELKFSLGGKKINGTFSVELNNPVIETVDTETETEKTTTLKFTPLDATQNLVLFVPAPVGKYVGINAKLYKEDGTLLGEWGKANTQVVVNKRSLKLMSEIIFDDVSGDTENNQQVATEEQLKTAVANGGTITLTENITLTDAITINKTVTIDLNGCTIENKSANNTTKLGEINDECIVFYVDGNEANLTLNATNGGKVIATGDGTNSYYNVAVWVTNGATVTINGGEYSNTADPGGDGCDLIYGRDGGKIYVTGGTFKAGAPRKDLGGGIYGVLNCKDTKGSVITVSGGKFYEYGAAEAAQVGNGEVILLEGGYYWSAKDTDGYYTVSTDITTEEALRSAITEGEKEEVTLGADITIESAIAIPTGITTTINLNGFDITAPNTDAFEVAGTLTIKDSNNEGVVSAGTANPSASVCAVWANGGKVTIEGGHYKVYSDAEGKRNDCIYAGYNADNNNTAGKIIINGGKFEYVWPKTKNNGSDYNGDMFLLNCADKDLYETLITVNGGQFKNNVPSYESTTPQGREDKEVKLGEGKKVYNGETEVTTAHDHKGSTDIWYVVK